MVTTTTTTTTGDDDSLERKSLLGASQLILLQLFSRFLTFLLGQCLLRFTSASTLGLAYVQFDLLTSTVLFLSREGTRCTLNRLSNNPRKVVNFSYLPIILGLGASLLTASLYIFRPPSTPPPPCYFQAVFTYTLAAWLELLVEPFYAFTLYNLDYSLRTRIEATAITLKAILTLSLTLLNGAEGGIMAFAWAQLGYSLVLMVGYMGVYSDQWRLFLLAPLSPSEPGRRRYWDDEGWTLVWTMTRQSFLKHVLTEGDRLLIKELCSLEEQGLYALVINYGGLITRMLFQPIEEASRTFFAKLLSPPASSAAKHQAQQSLSMLIKAQLWLGHLFLLVAPFYTRPLLLVLAGPYWALETAAPWLLAWYCGYVPFMGVNGLTEGFVQAVAPPAWLQSFNLAMVFTSLLYLSLGLALSLLGWGVAGLLMANMVNMTCRIIWAASFIKAYFLPSSPPAEKESNLYGVASWFPDFSITLVGCIGAVWLAFSPTPTLSTSWGLLREWWWFGKGFLVVLLLMIWT